LGKDGPDLFKYKNMSDTKTGNTVDLGEVHDALNDISKKVVKEAIKMIRLQRKKMVYLAYEELINDPKLPGCARVVKPLNEVTFPDGSVYEVTLTAKFKHKK
jgi:hypothetical protein